MTDTFRVQLPATARRPFLRISGLSRYAVLVFDAAAPPALAKLPRKAEQIPDEIVRHFLDSGPSARSWLRRYQMDGSKVPASLYPDMVAECERLRPSAEKTLDLDPREVADLRALGLDVSLVQPKKEGSR